MMRPHQLVLAGRQHMSHFADRFRLSDPDYPDEAPVSAAWLTLILARNALTECDDIAQHEFMWGASGNRVRAVAE